MKELTLEQVEEFLLMLQGEEVPDGMNMPEQPKLSRQAAWNVVWYLQEHLGVIPSQYEMCCVCDGLFDSYREGHIISDDDADDQFTKDLDITPEQIAQYQGADFCSESCERAFWEDPEYYAHPGTTLSFEAVL